MGLWQRIRSAVRVLASDAPPPPDDDWWYRGVAVDSSAGVRVDADRAMRVAAVLSCVRVLSESLASLPLFVYRRLANGGKERVPSHPLYEILHFQPNPWQTSFEFREMLQAHLTLRGNAYAKIVPGLRGAVDALIPMHPDRMMVEQLEDKTLRYKYRQPWGVDEVFMQDEIFHVRGLSSDGLVGHNQIELARESIGVSIAAEMHGASFFRNGARPGIVLEHPTHFRDKESAKEQQEAWERMHRGAANAHRTAILLNGLKAHEVGMTNEDSQFLETRKYQRSEIASLFRVPPHMIGDLEKATFSNIEQQSIDFVVHTLRPWLVRWEQALRRDLIQDDDVFAEFLVDGLLRGDVASRSAALQIQFMNGAINQDEWREIENRNPLPDGLGQVFYVPAALVPAGERPEPAPATQETPSEPPPEEQPNAESVNRGVMMQVDNSIAQIVNREVLEMRTLAEKFGFLKGREWISRLYQANDWRHKKMTERALIPVLLSCDAAWGVHVRADELSAKIIAETMRSVGDTSLKDACDGWASSRTAMLKSTIMEAIDHETTVAA